MKLTGLFFGSNVPLCIVHFILNYFHYHLGCEYRTNCSIN